ncbi:hypothetical protein [Micrococcus lylae]|uniref:hypothetical protein n=1 Tax=Micrococcus lylae TaxID=1273 RepID=UPI0011AF53F9|nr:hypothetical protein [Micrococcus lylae]WIK81943.1 hypothetical protein CJ228_010180 [Micrococcus lylae]
MAKNSTLGRLAGGKAMNVAMNSAFDKDGNPTDGFQKAVLRAIRIQRPLVLANIRRLHRRHPDESPAQIADRLNDQYLLAVTGAGAAVGGTAIIPGLGTVAALGLSAAAVVGFMETTALYAQSIAELHGISTDDPQRAEALVMAVMLGEDGRKMLRDFAAGQRGGIVPGGAANPSGLSALMGIGAQGSMSELFFQQMKKKFMRKMLVRQGAGFLGRAVPFGVGAVIGGVGNRAMGKAVVKSAQTLFGPLPAALPGEVVHPTTDPEQDEQELKVLEEKARKELSGQVDLDGDPVASPVDAAPAEDKDKGKDEGKGEGFVAGLKGRFGRRKDKKA